MQRVLHTERLHLRPLAPGDAAALHVVWGDPEVIWWGADRTPADTADRLARWIDRRSDPVPGLGWWLVFERDRAAAVGDIVLQPVPRDTGEVEVGWHLARPCWGRGLATEAARRVRDHAFDDLGLPLLVADIVAGNRRSSRVAEKLGMCLRPHPVKRMGILHDVWEIRPAGPPAPPPCRRAP